MDKVEEKIKSGVTAFVTTQDELGIHLQNALLDRGYKIPEDVSITGYGATEMTELTRPKLTSVKVPYYDIGAVAIRKILKEIKKEESGDKVYLPARIVERDSVKKIK